jgi:hypothetical protein
LFHTIRLTDGTWQAFGDVKGQAGDRGLFTDIAAANVAGELQTIGVTNDGKLWHTIRHANGTWDHFIDVKGRAGNPGAFTSVASAYVLVTIPVRVVTLLQDVGPRFLDANEIPQRDFNVVTQSPQKNDTQRWVLTQVQGSLDRIEQVSSSRFLEASLSEA